MMRWNILQHGSNKTIFHRMDWWRCMMILPMVSPWEEQPNFHGMLLRLNGQMRWWRLHLSKSNGARLEPV